jgi:hypothetical protein
MSIHTHNSDLSAPLQQLTARKFNRERTTQYKRLKTKIFRLTSSEELTAMNNTRTQTNSTTYIYIYSLFNDTVSGSDYKASNDKLINE